MFGNVKSSCQGEKVPGISGGSSLSGQNYIITEKIYCLNELFAVFARDCSVDLSGNIYMYANNKWILKKGFIKIR